MASGDYLLKLKADLGNFSRGMGSAQRQLTSVSNAARATGRNIDKALSRGITQAYNAARAKAKLRNEMQKTALAARKLQVGMNRVVTAMAGVGTTIVLFRTAAQAVVRFEKSMAEVRAITAANADAFKMMSKEAQHLGATTMFSGQQAAQGLKFLAMAGLSATQATKSLRATLNLAQAGAMDLGTAADIATNIMTAFKLSADDLNGVVDDIATTASRSNTSIQQLGDAMKYVSATASAYGMSLEESAAAIGVLSDAGMQASMAGTGFRQVLVRIAGQSSAMRKGMQALGISFAEINPEVNSLSEIIERFSQTNVTATQVSTMFGARAANAFNILLAGKDKLNSLTAEMQNNNGVAQQMADTMGNSLFGQLKKVQSAYEDFFITQFKSGEVAAFVGEKIQLVADSLNFLSGKLNVYESGADGVQKFNGQISESYATIETLIERISAVGTAVLAVAKAFLAIKVVGILSSAGAAMMAFFSRVNATRKAVLLKVQAMARLRASNAKLATSNGLLTNTQLKRVRAHNMGRLALLKESIASRGMAIRNNLLGVSAVGAESRVRRLAISVFGLNRGTRLAVNGTRALAFGFGLMATAATAAKIAVNALKVAVAKFFIPLIAIIAVIEVLHALWTMFADDGTTATAKLAKEVGRLEDEVGQLGSTLENAEFAIDVRKNDAGDFLATTDREGLPIGKDAPVKAFKDIRTEADKIRLNNAVEGQLNNAQDLAGRLKDKLREAYELDDADLISSLQEQISLNDQTIRQLTQKRDFILENADAYIAQANAVESLTSATKELEEASKKYATEAAALGDSAQGAYLMQIDVVEKLKLSVNNLADAERERERQLAEQNVAKYADQASALRQEAAEIRQNPAYERDKRLQDRAREKEAQADRLDVSAARERRRANRLDYEGPVSGQIEGDPRAREGTQLTSEQQAVVYGMKDELKQLEVDILTNVGFEGFDDIEDRYSELIGKLQDSGIETGVGSGFGDGSTETLIQNIRATRDLISATEDLNLAQRMLDAQKRKAAANTAGKSETEIDKEIAGLQAEIDLTEKLRSIDETNRRYAEATQNETDVFGLSVGRAKGTREDDKNPFNEQAGGSRTLARTALTDASAMGEEAVFLSGGNFFENLPVLDEYFTKLEDDYRDKQAENQAALQKRVRDSQRKFQEASDVVKLLHQNPNVAKATGDKGFMGLSLDDKNVQQAKIQFETAAEERNKALSDRRNVGAFTFSGASNIGEGTAVRGTQNMLANLQTAFAGTSLMQREFTFGEGENKQTKRLQDITAQEVADADQGTRTQLDLQMLKTANDFIASMKNQEQERLLLLQKMNTLQKNSVKNQAETLAKAIQNKIEAKIAADEHERRLAIMEKEAEIRSVNQEKALFEMSNTPDDEAGRAEKKSQLKIFDDQIQKLKDDKALLETRSQEEGAESERGLENLPKVIAEEIMKIRAEGGTEADIQSKILEIEQVKLLGLEEAMKNMGDFAVENKEAKQEVGDQERENKRVEQIRKAEDKLAQQRQNEAMKVAQNLEQKQTTGTAGVSSLAAIGGGGGVGSGSSVQDKQLEVQQQARDVLINMLKALQTPEGFEGKNDALNQMMNKLDNKELKTLTVGFNQLIEKAKNPNLNQNQRDALRGQAQALLDGFGAKAEGRVFNPEGNFLQDANGMAQEAANARPKLFEGMRAITNNAIPAVAPPNAPVAMAQPANGNPEVVAALNTTNGFLRTMVTNTSNLNGSIVVNASGGGLA